MVPICTSHLKAVVSCCSGGDGCGVEHARQSVLCAGVDHHPGCFGWAAVTLPAHISTVQGNQLINNPSRKCLFLLDWRALKSNTSRVGLTVLLLYKDQYTLTNHGVQFILIYSCTENYSIII